MSKNKPSVVFFGSGPVAAKSLKLLLSHQAVEAVVTKPSTVQQMTEVAGDIPVHTVSSRKELDNLIAADPFTSPLGILIDFGIIISSNTIAYFEHGIINSHFSLLPEWRGADPITFAILSGQEKTGVSLMLVDEGLDTGKILTQKSTHIVPNENSFELTSRLIGLSDELLQEYIPQYIKGEVKPRSQPHPDRATYSRKLTKADGILDFKKPAEVLAREIRAFFEWPKSRTEIAGKDVVIMEASADTKVSGTPGTIYKTADKKIGIYTSKGALVICMLKPAGKGVMSTESFLAGYGTKIQNQDLSS